MLLMKRKFKLPEIHKRLENRDGFAEYLSFKINHAL